MDKSTGIQEDRKVANSQINGIIEFQISRRNHGWLESTAEVAFVLLKNWV